MIEHTFIEMDVALRHVRVSTQTSPLENVLRVKGGFKKRNACGG